MNFVLTLELKRNPTSQLDNPRIIRRRDLAELGVVYVRARAAALEYPIPQVCGSGIQEIRVVEYIEKLHAKLNFHSFGNGSGL